MTTSLWPHRAPHHIDFEGLTKAAKLRRKGERVVCLVLAKLDAVQSDGWKIRQLKFGFINQNASLGTKNTYEQGVYFIERPDGERWFPSYNVEGGSYWRMLRTLAAKNQKELGFPDGRTLFSLSSAADPQASSAEKEWHPDFNPYFDAAKNLEVVFLGKRGSTVFMPSLNPLDFPNVVDEVGLGDWLAGRAPLPDGLVNAQVHDPRFPGALRVADKKGHWQMFQPARGRELAMVQNVVLEHTMALGAPDTGTRKPRL